MPPLPSAATQAILLFTGHVLGSALQCTEILSLVALSPLPFTLPSLDRGLSLVGAKYRSSPSIFAAFRIYTRNLLIMSGWGSWL